MRTKVWNKIATFLALMLTCICLLPIFSCKKEEKAAPITFADAVYGTMYYLPDLEEEYVVYDSAKKEMALTKEKGFFVEDLQGYTVQIGKKSYSIKVVTSGNERVALSYEKDYFAVGSEVELPFVIAHDEAGKELTYTATLTKGEQVIETADNKFTPDSVGSYTYTVKADYFGKTVEKKATIEVVEDGSYKLRLVAELGEEYGLNQACKFFGATPEYTTEKAFGRDSGSLKVTLNNDRTYNQEFTLRNLFIKDLTACDELYFYVYNDSDYELTLSVNFGTFPVIQPHCWTRISLTDFENELITWSHASNIKDNFNLESIEGLTIADFFGDYWTGLGTFSLYFSSVYTWGDMSADGVVNAMKELSTLQTYSEGELYEFITLENKFDGLSWDKQEANYDFYDAAKAKFQTSVESAFKALPTQFTLADFQTFTNLEYIYLLTEADATQEMYDAYAAAMANMESSLSATFNTLPAQFSATDASAFLSLRSIYEKLSWTVQSAGKAAYQGAMRKYIDYLEAKNNLVKEPNVSVYFDRAYGLEQVIAIDCNLALDDKVKYDDKATTKLSVTSAEEEIYQSIVYMQYPSITDCTNYEEAYVYVRYDGDESVIATFSWEETDYVKLVKGEWVKVSFKNWTKEDYPFEDKANAYGIQLYLFKEDWSVIDSLEVHLSSVFVG